MIRKREYNEISKIDYVTNMIQSKKSDTKFIFHSAYPNIQTLSSSNRYKKLVKISWKIVKDMPFWYERMITHVFYHHHKCQTIYVQWMSDSNPLVIHDETCFNHLSSKTQGLEIHVLDRLVNLWTKLEKSHRKTRATIE